MADRSYNVLFLCYANSARSIIAEAILNQAGKGSFHAYSAGSHPAGTVHPQTIAYLERHHIPTGHLRSKDWSEFAAADAPRMDFVLTVCDRAAGEACPVWPGQPMTAHWGVADPVAATGDEERQLKAFADTYMLLNRRITLFLNLPLDKLDRLSLRRELDDIGRSKA